MSTPLGESPAFPVPLPKEAIKALSIEQLEMMSGMTIRVWLAGTIAAGMWANETWRKAAFAPSPNQGCAQMALVIVEATDALLSALQAPTPANPPQGIPLATKAP